MPATWKRQTDTTDITPHLTRMAVRDAGNRRLLDRGKPLSLGNVYHMPYPIVFKRLPKSGPSREAICAAMQDIEAQGHFQVRTCVVRNSDDEVEGAWAWLDLTDEDGEVMRNLLEVTGDDELNALDRIQEWLDSHGPAAA